MFSGVAYWRNRTLPPPVYVRTGEGPTICSTVLLRPRGTPATPCCEPAGPPGLGPAAAMVTDAARAGIGSAARALRSRCDRPWLRPGSWTSRRRAARHPSALARLPSPGGRGTGPKRSRSRQGERQAVACYRQRRHGRGGMREALDRCRLCARHASLRFSVGTVGTVGTALIHNGFPVPIVDFASRDSRDSLSPICPDLSRPCPDCSRL